MVKNIPERFKKVALAFDASHLCESSGSEHSPATKGPTDLSDLVASFVEGEAKTTVEETKEGTAVVDDENDIQDNDSKSGGFDFEATKESLKEIFGRNLGVGGEDRRMFLAEVEAAFESIGHHENNSHDFKGGLMAFLRKRGFDAGLCKSWWEKTARFPDGEYQYVDVNVNGVRYIIEASLAGQFEIARPTNQSNMLVELLPPIFVGLPDELKQVVRLLSAAIKQSLWSRGLLMPPWRKSGYTKAKWFCSYKRTMNRDSALKPKCTNTEVRSITGFKAPGLTAGCYCQEDFAMNNSIKAGLLSEALAIDSS